jgi:hypothetical protein
LLGAAVALASLGLLLPAVKAPARRFSEHLIAGKYGYAFGLAAADLDGGKRLDVAATAERGANEVRWWRNLGPRK